MKNPALRILLLSCIADIAFGQQQRDVAVTVSTPRGLAQSVDQYQTIVATFNQPMVALKEVPEDEGTGPMIIDPAVPGKFRWMGTATLTFIPAKRLPYGTEYTVRIPAGTRSISGQTMPQEFSWQFQTVRPTVLYTEPYTAQQYVELNHRILLRFNQSIDAEVVSKYISVEAHGPDGIISPVFSVQMAIDDTGRPAIRKRYGRQPWRRKGADQNAEQTVLIILRDGLKKGTSYAIRCRQGLPGLEGPLGMVND
jgi:hypothetical protein